MYRTPKIPSLARRISVSFLLGGGIACLGAVIDRAVTGAAFSLHDAVDDVVIGIVAALVVFFYEQRRHRAIMEKVRVIAGMNHHIRNALQAISYVPYTEQEKQIKTVEESVQRIEWALREILPGEREEGNGNEAFPPGKRPTERSVI